jgi:hypothetical protein
LVQTWASLFRRRTFWLLFGPSKSNKEKMSLYRR